MVNWFEECDVRIEAGYTLLQWYNELDGYDRAIEVAHYRIRHSIEYHKSLAIEKSAELQNKKK